MNSDEQVQSETTFADLGLRDELLDALTALGYEEPTPIQREAIPALMTGTDLIGQAATGTGKTAAFALPLLNQLDGDRRNAPSGLVLVPTRELAVQVSEATHKYGTRMGARVLPVYGGAPIGRQLRELERGVDIVIATPGRAVDLIQRGKLVLDSLQTVVLDEADEMLDMGFADELEAILSATPSSRQTVLFSATMPPRLDRIMRGHLKNPTTIQIGRETTEAGASPRVRQTAYIVKRPHKPAALGRILDTEAPTAAIVFCRTRAEVDTLTATLNGRGYRAEGLHGGLTQEQRDRVMGRLRNGTTELLVATDVAARGLDVDHLTHVVNYDVPSAPEAYVHRIGRVGRAGREGVAITLAEPREHRMLKVIERVSKQRISIEKVPTIEDLRARRLQLLTSTLTEALEDEGREHYRVVVETLTDEFDLMDIALAAVKIAHIATGGEIDEEEIPQESVPGDARPAREYDRPRREDRARDERPRYDKPREERVREDRPAREDRPVREDRPSREDRVREDRPRWDKPRDDRPERSSFGKVKLYIAVGHDDGVRPADIVGAIAGESGIPGKQVGGIEISDRFCLVEVPEAEADRIVASMRNATIVGRKAGVRRERAEGRAVVRDDRGSYDKPRWDKPRDDRPRDDKPKYGKSRDDKPKYAKSRDDRSSAPSRPGSKPGAGKTFGSKPGSRPVGKVRPPGKERHRKNDR